MKKRSADFCNKVKQRQTGDGNSFFGKKHTPEALIKISISSTRNNKKRNYIRTPFQQLKAEKKMEGIGWCRKCLDWHPLKNIHSGLCKKHQREQYREMYRKNPDKIKQRVYARKRNLKPMPVEFRSWVLEKFNNKCGYCGNTATGIDHFLPVKLGGINEPNNLIPCCTTCNSQKKDTHPSKWDFDLTEDILDIIIPTAISVGKIHHLNNINNVSNL